MGIELLTRLQQQIGIFLFGMLLIDPWHKTFSWKTASSSRPGSAECDFFGFCGERPLGPRVAAARLLPRMRRPLFIAATRQHVGKTTVSLAIMSGLQKRLQRIGFVKPVGQQHVPVQCSNGLGEVRVDKDVQLMREYFRLDHIDYPDMSPVLVPRSYTKSFIDGAISSERQIRTITSAMERVHATSEMVVVEGTGHVRGEPGRRVLSPSAHPAALSRALPRSPALCRALPRSHAMPRAPPRASG